MLKNYFLVAFRNVMRNRIYTLLNVIGLALGLACGLIIFWFIRFQTTLDTFHANVDKIHQVNTVFSNDGIFYNRGVPPHMSKAIRKEIPEIKASMCVVREDMLMSVLDKNGKPIKKFKNRSTVGAFVEASYFEIFTFPWRVGNAGKTFTKPNVIALSHNLAERYFGNENPIGKVIRFENELNLEVVGVFHNIPENTELRHDYFISFATLEVNKNYNYGGPDFYDRDGSENWGGVNSETHCFTLFPANLKLASLAPRMEALTKKYHPTENLYFKHNLVYFRGMHFDGRYQGNSIPIYWFWIMGAIGGFLIITACFNFINMATAQAMQRAKEVGVRKSLGSTNGQIFRQFMTETGIVVFFSLLLGLGLATSLLPYLNVWLNTSLWQKTVLWNDWGLWATLLGGFCLVTLLGGLYPAFILAGFKPIVALKGSVSTRQVGGISLRRALIVFQFVWIQLLLICTLVVNQQTNYMLKADLGYNIQGIVDFNVPRPDSINQETFKQRMLKIRGVEKITLRSNPPTAGGMSNTRFNYENRKELEKWAVSTKNGDESYIDTYGLKLVAGKNLPKSDSIAAFLVNERFVERLGLANPAELVGKYLTIWGRKAQVCGVVKNFHDRSLQTEINPTAIFSFKNNYGGGGIRMNASDTAKVMRDIGKLWNEYFPDYIFQYGFLDESVAKQYAGENATLKLIRFFSFIAVFIGCLGMYGLIRFLAVQKTKEIGVRKAYGATVSQILYLFGIEMLRLISIGFLIATPLAYYLMDLWLQTYIYRIDIARSISLLALVALSITFLLAALTVGYESYKAAQKNPSLSLRST